MTDEFRKNKYENSEFVGMHYAKCYGELVLIPDKLSHEEYEFNSGMGQMYTQRQIKNLYEHKHRILYNRKTQEQYDAW